MKRDTNLQNLNDMKMLKFFLAAIAGFGLIKFFGYITEAELNEEEDNEI